MSRAANASKRQQSARLYVWTIKLLRKLSESTGIPMVLIAAQAISEYALRRRKKVK